MNPVSVAMYLVELRPGKEELYRTVDELAAAIRSGDVDVHSRIFHRATSKWISITLHPQFRAIAAARDSEPQPAPRKQWTFLMSATDEMDAEQRPERDTETEATDTGTDTPTAMSQADEAHAEEVADPTQMTSDATNPPAAGGWRRPFTLGVTGLILIGGVQLAFSAPRPSWPRFGLPAALAQGITTLAADRGWSNVAKSPPTTSSASLASSANWTPVGYPLPDSNTQAWTTPPRRPVPRSAAADTVMPSAPEHLATETSVTETALLAGSAIDAASEMSPVDSMIQRYDEAYHEAHQKLERGLAPLHELLAPYRIASAYDVGQLRRSLDEVGRALQAYRAREGEIERNHQDTFAVVSRQFDYPPRAIRRWYARTSHRESRAAAALVTPLLVSVDSVLAVLEANAGEYAVDEMAGTIAFDRPEVAAEYGRLRGAVDERLSAAQAEADASSSGALAQLVEIIGTTSLPIE